MDACPTSRGFCAESRMIELRFFPRPFVRRTCLALTAAAVLLAVAAPSMAQDQKSAAKAAASKSAAKSATKSDTKTGAKSDEKAPTSKSAQAAKPAAVAPPGGSQAMKVADYGEWGVFTANRDKSKVCYAMTQ